MLLRLESEKVGTPKRTGKSLKELEARVGIEHLSSPWRM